MSSSVFTGTVKAASAYYNLPLVSKNTVDRISATTYGCVVAELPSPIYVVLILSAGNQGRLLSLVAESR